ncbi:hypothetical protein [Paenarthrobacter sp. NPDC058040]|uniref:hypothetical protein n=1 Tax=unclassified Paenarthrobacter TaxID=2634190 RepID=UPI0036DF9534
MTGPRRLWAVATARAFRAETTKLLTLPLFLYAAAGSVVLTVGLSWILTSLVASALQGGRPKDAGGLEAGIAFLSILHFGQIGVILLGAWVVHQEAGSGSLRSTLVAVPQRASVFAAKALLVFTGALLTAIPSVFGAAGIRCTVIDCGADNNRIAPDPASSAGILWGVVLYWTLIALLTYALSVALRSGLAAMGSVLALVLVVSTFLLPITRAARFLPDQAGAQLYQHAPQPPDALGALGGGLVLLAWVIVAMTMACILFSRHPVRS